MRSDKLYFDTPCQDCVVLAAFPAIKHADGKPDLPHYLCFGLVIKTMYPFQKGKPLD
jgi:hypothetical protein